jgi:peptide/nickel transport system substrate-binding protein
VNMKAIARLALVVCLCAAMSMASAPTPQPANQGEELARVEGATGRYGGRLVVGQRSEPKMLNPVTATDAVSREVFERLHADLIGINRATQKTEPALAKSWKMSLDGRTFTLKLRKGIRFSDGHPFDADDVVFSFTVYLDEAVSSPQRDLLLIDGKPLTISKLDQYTVRFSLPRPYAAAERLFDSFAILPRHILEKPYREGKFVQAWPLNAPPTEVVGLGPFRVKQYWPGQRILLERNPYYWKADRDNHRLPYLDELVFLFVGSEDAQVMRFEAGETDLINRLSSENYSWLSKEQSRTGFAVNRSWPQPGI